MSDVTVNVAWDCRLRALSLRFACPTNDNRSHHISPFHRRGSMRIAQISPLTEAVPPKLYGGTERIRSYITDELGTMGHNVTFFLSGGTNRKAKLEAGGTAPLRFAASNGDPPHPP